MNGILAHSSPGDYLDTILKEGKLKPSSITNIESNDYHGSNIFFTLIPEDINIKDKHLLNKKVVFYFKPALLETYGKKQFKSTIFDKEIMEEYRHDIYPTQKVWFTTGWNFGLFEEKLRKGMISINYNPELSLQENIKLFNKILHKVKPKYIFKLLSIFHFENEVVIQSNSIPLKKNLLTVYLDEKYYNLKVYRERYPNYTFVGNKKDLAKIVKDYYTKF